MRLLGWLGGLVVFCHCSGRGMLEELRVTMATFPGSVGLVLAHRGAVAVASG